jgi:hypothetical protein
MMNAFLRTVAKIIKRKGNTVKSALKNNTVHGE